ncbi:hypothetical protein FRB95_001124 [Tulasnella sp. JGI-2019a]|nr:hypothetical protein FRB95_001124 [Tulasnella sp. JGI-2019a]
MLALETTRPHQHSSPSHSHSRDMSRPLPRTSSSRMNVNNSTSNIPLANKPSIVSLSKAVKRIFRSSSKTNVPTVGDGITCTDDANGNAVMNAGARMGKQAMGMGATSVIDLRNPCADGVDGRDNGANSPPQQQSPPPSSFLAFAKRARPKSLQPSRSKTVDNPARPCTSIDGGGSSRSQAPPPPLPSKSVHRTTPSGSGSDSGYGGSQPTSARTLPPLNGNNSSVRIGGGTPDSVQPPPSMSSSTTSDGMLAPPVPVGAASLPGGSNTSNPSTSGINTKNIVYPTQTPITSNNATLDSHPIPKTNGARNAATTSRSSSSSPSQDVATPPKSSAATIIPNLPPPPPSTPRNPKRSSTALSKPGTPRIPTTPTTTSTSSLRLRIGADSLPPLLPNLPVITPMTPTVDLSSSTGASSSGGGAPYDGLPTGSESSKDHPLMTPQESGTFNASPSTPVGHRTRSATTGPGASTLSNGSTPSGIRRPHSNSLSSGMTTPRLVGGTTPGSYMVPMDAMPGTSTMPGGTTMKMTPSMVLHQPRPPMTPQMKYPSLLLGGVSMGAQDEGGAGAIAGAAAIAATPAVNVNGVPTIDASTSTPVRAPAATSNRPMAPAMPALRRDGSSFYLSIGRRRPSQGTMSAFQTAVTRAASTSTSEPVPAEMEMEDDGMDSGSDEEEGHPADEMEEEDHQASDDEDDDDDDMRTTTTHDTCMTKQTSGSGASGSGIGGVVKTIGTGLRSLAAPSFLRTLSGGSGSSSGAVLQSTPSPASRSRGLQVEGGTGIAIGTSTHRKSLSGLGAPSMELHTTVEDEQMEHQDQQQEEEQEDSSSFSSDNAAIMTPKTKTSVSSTATERANNGDVSTPTNPEAQARPRPPKPEVETLNETHESNRETVYHTPPASLPVALEPETFNTRESTYYDALETELDEGHEEGVGHVGAVVGSPAQFSTSLTSGSTSTLTPEATPTRPVMISSAPSAATIRAATRGTAVTATLVTTPTRRPSQLPHASSNGSGSSESSALGLDLSSNDDRSSLGANDAGDSHDTPLAPVPLTNPASNAGPSAPPSSARRWDDYFSSKTFLTSPQEGVGLRRDVSSRLSPRIALGGGASGLQPVPPRTPGGRPVLFTHTSQSMIDLATPQQQQQQSMHIQHHSHQHQHQQEKTALGLSVITNSPAPTYKGKEREAFFSKAVEEDGYLSTAQPTQPAVPRSPMMGGAAVPMKSPSLSRRRSMPDMTTLRAHPPPYPKYFPREDEGMEKLPPYSCRIHFEASVQRKMEFSGPGLMARDRAWKRVYVVVNGTSLTVFKQNPRQHAIKPGTVGGHVGGPAYAPAGRRGDGVVDVDDVVIGAPHVHLPEDVLIAATSRMDVRPTLNKAPSRSSNVSNGRRSSMDGRSSASRGSFDGMLGHPRRRSADIRSSANASRTSLSSSGVTSPSTDPSSVSGPSASETSLVNADDEGNSEKRSSVDPAAAAKQPSVIGDTRPSNSQSANSRQLLASFQNNTVLRKYSLQGAETGLASDYAKRKFVIRVRAEGEQFLLQADNILMAIDWIETFQAGANVALDLDERPMPKPPALPRRRRRRRTDAGNTNGSGPSAQAADGQADENAARRGSPTGEPTTSSSPPTEPPASASSSRSRFSFGRRREPQPA